MENNIYKNLQTGLNHSFCKLCMVIVKKEEMHEIIINAIFIVG